MNDDHLDDEALSASLDGQLDDVGRAHLTGCNRCSARQADLRAVALALGEQPPAPSAVRRDAAVATAMRATRPSPSARRPRFFSPPVLVAVAAAVVAVAVAVPLLTRSSGRPRTTSAAAPLQASKAPLTVADLGAIDSESALHDAVARLASNTAGATRSAGGAGAAPPPAPQAGAPSGAATPPGAEATVSDGSVPVCEADLLRQLRRTDAPRYEAVLVWQGTPAVVFAFTSTRTEVYVTARAGCRILVFERFST